ncbi:GapS4b family protein [Alcaligenes sp. HNGD-HTN06]|uniref:GapS4b family protein n=1 Tax=Alcaligenes sp. HNGD-HTN06 TaxID=3416924 RepID=UPI003CF80959
MKQVLDSNYLIPLGAELRVLLNSEHISYGEVNSVLKAKGIFSGSNDKSITVPLLAATLLTPSGYSALIEASVDRDSKPKVKVSALDLVASGVDWITPLKQLFDSDFNPFVGIANIEVIDTPGVIVEGKDKVRIPFSIVRKDFSKDWTQRELRFDGEVAIELQGGSLKLDFSSTHSSKETEIASRRMTARMSKVLKESGITKSEIERRITFDSFTNVERVRFFKRLTGGYGRFIAKGSVNEMEINRDASGPPLPNDPQVSWMNQTVKRLKIDGEKLNDIFLISDEKYYPYYHVQRMDVTFGYASAANSGEFRVSFFFSTPSRVESAKDDAELTFEVLRVTYDHTVNSDSKKELNSQISRHVRGLVETQFERIVTERM